MKPTLFAIAALVSLCAATTTTGPAGYVYWPGGAPPADGPKGAKFENHALGITHRDKDGAAEVHENQTDVMVIQTGEATLLVGGELVAGKTTRPGELQGTSIQGGTKQDIKAGDIIHIRYRTPHQMFLHDGKPITYFVVKVDKP